MNADGPKFKAYVDQQRLSKVKLAEALGMTKQNLFQLFKSKELKPETKQRIEKALRVKWDVVNKVNIDHSSMKVAEKVEKMDLSGVDQMQPVIQVVLNLSYIGKKNADSIDKMADSNLLNAKSISTLVNLIASNSDLASLLMSSQSAQHTEDGFPVEAFLGENGADAIRKQMAAGKKRKVGN